jgi:hypothetical protein
MALLPRASPGWCNSQPTGISGFHDAGFWVITKHAIHAQGNTLRKVLTDKVLTPSVTVCTTEILKTS